MSEPNWMRENVDYHSQEESHSKVDSRICLNCKRVLRPNENHFAYAVGHTPSSGWMCSPPPAPSEGAPLTDELDRLVYDIGAEHGWGPQHTAHRTFGSALPALREEALRRFLASRLSAAEARHAVYEESVARLAQAVADAEARAAAAERDLREACREREEWRELMQQWKDEAKNGSMAKAAALHNIIAGSRGYTASGDALIVPLTVLTDALGIYDK